MGSEKSETAQGRDVSPSPEICSTRAAEQNKRVGRIVVLPKSMRESYRYIKDMFYDSVAMSQELGKPVWMITLTTNRNWPEIQDECRRSRTDSNFRFDVCNRSFDLRRNSMHSHMVWEQIFGRVKGYCTVEEYQGRGLKHEHHLYVMDEADAPITGEDVDRMIWAFFPDKAKHPRLFELVVRLMIHTPCLTPNAPCRRKGRAKCKAGFPFDFRDTTDISGKRPLYRRPNDGRGIVKTINGQRFFIDKRWIVPFNPLLLLEEGAHINVMYCPSTSACKYFYGYVFKGSFSNRVRLSIAQRNADSPNDAEYNHDEIQE